MGGLGAAVREPLPVVFVSAVPFCGGLVGESLADMGEVFKNQR